DPALERTLSPLLIERAGNTPNVRRNAIRALTAINVESLKTAIAGSLANTLRHDSDQGVRLEAANALGLIGPPAQADPLYTAIDKPEEAISHLAAALKHWDSGAGHVTEGLQNNLMHAFLRARQYKEGIAFATERIMRNDQNQETMARAILQEVDRLSRAKQYT